MATLLGCAYGDTHLPVRHTRAECKDTRRKGARTGGIEPPTGAPALSQGCFFDDTLDDTLGFLAEQFLQVKKCTGNVLVEASKKYQECGFTLVLL